MVAKSHNPPVEPASDANPIASLARVEELGIVGAGGGGFPTAVKLKSRASLLIANAAECEPLLHKDKELLHHLAEPFLRGMRMAMEMVGASEGVVGIKEKYQDIIAALESQAGAGIRVVAAARLLPCGRRVHSRAHGHWPRDSAGRVAERCRCIGRQRRNPDEHRPRSSRNPQIPHRGRRRCNTRSRCGFPWASPSAR